MKKLKLILVACILIANNHLFSQTTGIITGFIQDEKNEPMLYASIAVLEENKIIRSAITDEKGYFTIKELIPGRYTIKVAYLGYNVSLLKNVEVDPSQIAYVDIKLIPSDKELPPITVIATWEKPIIDPKYTTCTFITIEKIEQTVAPKGDIISLAVALTPAILPTNDGKDLLMRGSRRGTTSYIVDGNKTMDVPNVPAMGIANMEILTGGIPAEYGDVTGGLVIITTKDYNWEMTRKRIKKQEK